MKTTVSTTQRSDARHWMRTALMAAFALLLTATAHPAGAEEKTDPAKAAEGQIIGCALAGGGAHVEVERTANGLTTSVTCIGGLLDGVGCTNDANGTECDLPSAPGAHPVDGWHVPVTEVVGVLESGSQQQIAAMVVDLQGANPGDQGAAPDAPAEAPAPPPSVTEDDDQDHDQDTTTGKKVKKGKHGKKGGKHRKR